MPKYTPNTSAGETRHRIWAIGGTNPNPLATPGAAPRLTFHEEEVALLADGSERTVGRTRNMETVYDPAQSLVTRNPVTDAAGPVGRIPADLTMAEAFVVLYTLGRHAQTVADAEAAAAAAAEAARAAAAAAAEAARAAAAAAVNNSLNP